MLNYGLKSVSPVPSKQSMAENERFIVIQQKPLLKFAFTGLDQGGGDQSKPIFQQCPEPDNWSHTEITQQALGFRYGMRES
jgi:hypothetical protein